jgi:hypothetical protein
MLKYAIFCWTGEILPERYDTPKQAKEAWGYAVIDGKQPKYIETVRDDATYIEFGREWHREDKC